MSVTKDKTLAKVRTFARDFNEHQKNDGVPDSVKSSTPKDAPTVVIAKKESFIPPKDRAPVTEPKIVVPETTAPKINHIPSFHEIQKKVDTPMVVKHTPDASTTKKPTIKVSKKSSPTRRKVNVGVDATVITANKRTMGNASQPSFFTSIGNWFTSLIAGFSKDKTPQYTVRDTVRRKGVIEKATTKSGTIFTGDNYTLREQILRRREEEENQKSVTWSPYTDPGYNLLETKAAHEAVVKVTYKTNSLPQPEITEPADNRWGVYSEELVPEKIDVVEPPLEVTPITAPIEIVPDIQQPVIIPEPIVETPLSVDPEPVLVPVTSAITRAPRISLLDNLRALFRNSNTSELNTNAVAISALMVIASIFLLVLAGQFVLGLFVSESDIPSAPPALALATSAPTIDIVLPAISSSELRTAINKIDAVATTPEQEVRFVTTNQTVVTPQQISSLLDLRINPNFRESIEELHFLVVDNIQTALVLRVEDPITALGGMLEWEENIEQDLKNILNTISVPTESKRFVDKTYTNVDARILTDDVDEILVYGFINENTILITKTTDTFVRLAN